MGIFVSDKEVTSFFNEFCQNCKKITIKKFSRGDVVTTYIANRKQLCMLRHGEAELIRYDLNGNKNIVEHYVPGNIFGEIFYNVTTNNELFVEARTRCEVLFFDYDLIENKCTQSCSYHKKVTKTLPTILLSQINSLNTRIELLGKRTIKEKLVTYFNVISAQHSSRSFTLPFSLTDLADYLSVDRSAMMREISNLKNDNVIEKIGNKITLL